MLYRICGLRPGMIKFMLILAFIFNMIGWTGFKTIVNSLPPLTEDSKFSREEELRRKNLVWHYAGDLVKVAQERCAYEKIYSPYDYFHDLKLIYLKEKELEVKSFNIHTEINKLQALANKSLKRGYTENDIGKAREDYKEFIEPGHESREKAREHLQQIGWYGILNWFLWLYLKTLPLVFILYFLWAKEELGYYERFLIPKPFGFAVLLLLYPFVIGFYICCWFKNNGRHIYAEAELRRSKRLFAYLSEEDQERIRQFAKTNLSLSYWRRQLTELGLKPRHSLTSALLVTLIFVFVIRPVEASAKSIKDFSGSSYILEQISTKNLPRMSIDGVNKIQPEQSDWPLKKNVGDMAVQVYEFVNTLPYSFLPRDTFRKFIDELIREIFHVPLQAVQFEAKLAVQTQS